MINLQEALNAVAKSPNHRVLSRLPGLPQQIMPGVETRMGLYLDCEATGLNLEKDEVTELGTIPFRFTLDGRHIEAMQFLHWYNEPSLPISAEITRITGITLDKVRGHKIDIQHLEAVLDVTDIVIAHNAEYDRQMLERVSTKFERKCWGCSMSQVPWSLSTRKLEWILSTMGYFYDAHNAVSDCQAGLFAISQPLGMPKDPTEREQALTAGEFETGLSHILEASRKYSYHIWAVDASYDLKDDLKARKYFWNSGEDGRPKAWHKEVDSESMQAESEWLQANIYRGTSKFDKVIFDKVTAFDRFSKRG